MDGKVWYDMLHLGVPVVEKILRPVLVYAFLVVGLRLAGKRELAQLNPFDLVVLLTLSNTVQNAIISSLTRQRPTGPARHEELVARLDRIAEELAALRAARATT